MANLKALKNRIKSVKSTQKITKAMKMVAASKLRRSQLAAEAARPFALAMEGMLRNLAAGFTQNDSAPPLLIGNGRDDRHMLIVATSDRGLCGGFNSSIIKGARLKIRQLAAEGKKIRIFSVGRKSEDALKKNNDIVEKITGLSRRAPTFKDAENIAHKIISMYNHGEFDVCGIFYNHFKSAISQEVTYQQLIPLLVDGGGWKVEGEETTNHQPPTTNHAPYEYEPNEEEILKELLPQNLAIQIYRALLENAASEQAARMMAMDNATRNAGDMIKDLTLVYNRTRQAAITKELIEIISGAEAV